MLKNYELDYVRSVGSEGLDFRVLDGSRTTLLIESESDSFLVPPHFEYGDLKKWVMDWPCPVKNKRNLLVARSHMVAGNFARQTGLDEIEYVSFETAHRDLRGVGSSGDVVVRVFIEDIESNSRKLMDNIRETGRLAKRGFATDRILEVQKFRLP